MGEQGFLAAGNPSTSCQYHRPQDQWNDYQVPAVRLWRGGQGTGAYGQHRAWHGREWREQGDHSRVYPSAENYELHLPTDGYKLRPPTNGYKLHQGWSTQVADSEAERVFADPSRLRQVAHWPEGADALLHLIPTLKWNTIFCPRSAF